jgi:multiple sugar transport system ATP-binding protein
MGSEFYLHATVGADKQNVVMRIQTTDLPAQYHGGVPYGTKMNFTFRPQLIHMFDPETEKSLLF